MSQRIVVAIIGFFTGMLAMACIVSLSKPVCPEPPPLTAASGLIMGVLMTLTVSVLVLAVIMSREGES